MNADTLFTLLVGLLITLALGAYGYTFILGRDIRSEIGKLWNHVHNHFEHRIQDAENRLANLEQTREQTREEKE